MAGGMSFGSSSIGGMSYAQFSPGLGQVAMDLNTGKLAKELLSNALAAVKLPSFVGAATAAFGGAATASFGGAGAAGVSAGGAASVSASGFASVSASGSASVSIPMQRQIETTRMVTVQTEKKVMVPTTRQVPDLANAGKLEAKGNNEVTTPGGYKVKLEGDTAYVTAPNGKQIRVWGDPHIESSDGKGGKQNIDFRKGTTSFMLPDGSRITMNAYDDKGKLAANGMLGKLDIYNGNKHVTLSNGREQTGKTGGVSTSGVKHDGHVAAANQATGDVLNVVGDGAQLAYQGKLTKHESVSGTVRKGEWSTGAFAGAATVGAQAMQVPMKTITDFKEVTVKGFEQKLIKEMKTITENVTFTSNQSVSASAGQSVGANAFQGVSASASGMLGNAFAVNGGFGGFSSGSFGNFTLPAVGGAFGGAGLYGSFANGAGAHYGSLFSSQSNSISSGAPFPFASVANYISGAANGTASVLNSFNQNINALSQSRYASTLDGGGGPIGSRPGSNLMATDWTPDRHTTQTSEVGGGWGAQGDTRLKGGGPAGVDWKEVTEKKTITEWRPVTETRAIEKIRELPPKHASTQITFDNAVPYPGANLSQVKPQDVDKARGALAGISAEDLRKPGASIDISAFASARGNSTSYGTGGNQLLTERRAEYTANAFRSALREKGLSDTEIDGLIKKSAHGSTQAKNPEGASIPIQQPDRRCDVSINIPGAKEKYTDFETITKQVPVQREIEVKRQVPVPRPPELIAAASDQVATGPGHRTEAHVEVKQNPDGTFTINSPPPRSY